MKVYSVFSEFVLSFSRIGDKVRVFPLFAFLIPLLVRAIPEVLMRPYVVGFDTLAYYVPNTLTWLSEGVGFWRLLAEAPLFYMLLMGVTSIGVPIVYSLKILAPLLLGLLGLIVYYYAKRTLGWSLKKSLLVSLFATLYFVALRISWDMLRSELGLILLFTALILLGKGEKLSIRNGILLSVAMFSVVLAHQLVSVIMFFILLVSILRLYNARKIGDITKIVAVSIPTGLIFLLIVYANFVASSEFSLVGGLLGQDGGFMSLFGFASYPELVVDTLGFLVFCFLPLSPLLYLGIRKFKGNLHLKAWIIWIFVALLFVIVSPNASFVVVPYRWTLLLVYPLAFFAAQGFAALKRNLYKWGAGLILSVISFGFILGFPFFSAFPYYVPSLMLQNTVSINDCQNTANSLSWMEANFDSDSRLLVHDAFYGWAMLSLDRSQLIRYNYTRIGSLDLSSIETESESNLYLIWWVNGSGWHGQSSISSVFEPVYESGKIAVYKYNFDVTNDRF